jgi:glycosyltransferase involved in cell wall biosynthesis/L-amino acid N-acyltransferase YncA
MRHDVAIYTTSATTAGSYDRTLSREDGAERQMMLLARALAARGWRVAHIVYPPRDPVPLPERLTLIPRGPYGRRRRLGSAIETLEIWRALAAADARVVIVRGASPALGVVAAFCKLKRRALIFSSSNNSDFTLERVVKRHDRRLYGRAIRRADVVVVQSADQERLARKTFPSLRRVVRIPSFAAAAAPSDGNKPDAFLWFSRTAPYKQPLRYVDLARAVPHARFLMIPVPDDLSQLGAVRAAAATVPNLELLDPLPHERLWRLISRAAAVVNTSVYEGMPNAFLEAWAHGVPVLTLRFDPDEVVARNGLGISAGGSWDRFVEGAQELWEGRSNREEFARHAREYVSAVHSTEVVGSRWSDLIEEPRPLRDLGGALDEQLDVPSLAIAARPRLVRMRAVDLLAESGPRALLDAVGRKAWSTHHALGLRCSSETVRVPRRAKVALRMEPEPGASVLADIEQELANAGSDDVVELVSRRRMCEQRIEVLYVGRSDSGKAIYLQWLVGHEEQHLLHASCPHLFPHLAEREFLVEGAYTFADFRRMGAMAEGMYQLVATAQALGATSVLTYVSFGNVPSLRGCAAVGFEPDHVRVTTQQMGRRRSRYVPLDEEGSREWRHAVPNE